MTLDSYRDGLEKHGYTLGTALNGSSHGAWSATAHDGTAVVLKWIPAAKNAARYGSLIPALEELRARGAPVPEYFDAVPFEDGTLTVQNRLPGRSIDHPPDAVIEDILRFIDLKYSIPGPVPTGGSWGNFVVKTLCVGHDSWCNHRPLREWGSQSAVLLERITSIGAQIDASEFANDGMVHLDLHTDNILVDEGRLSGVIDWETAVMGDHRFDLVQFIFDLDGHGRPAWELVDGFPPKVLRAYLALLVLKTTSSAIRARPDDVGRQLDRAERLL